MNPLSHRGQAKAAEAADWLAAAVFASLPWSTSATGILIFCWIVAVLPTLSRSLLLEHLRRPAVFLPLALWALLCLGMLWSDKSWSESLDGLKHFHKLLVLPLLIIHFSRSERGLRAFGMFVVSSIVLLLYSWASWWWPSLVYGNRAPGVPVKDYIFQGTNFVLSACVLCHVALVYLRDGKHLYAGLCAALVALFAANVVFVSISRTALISFLVLLLVVGYQHFGKKGALALTAIFIIVCAVGWTTSSDFRTRVMEVSQAFVEEAEAPTSTGQRLMFWRKSLEVIQHRPLFGYGTGALTDLFVPDKPGEKLDPFVGPNNPHNQTFAVGIQVGLVGVALLYLMWAAHLVLFVGQSWPARFGLLIVLQNIVNSLFNSHLSDFTAGWLYVFGVGALAGALHAAREASPLRAGSPAAAEPEDQRLVSGAVR